jgi:hypothetical protein
MLFMDEYLRVVKLAVRVVQRRYRDVRKVVYSMI